MSLTFGLDYDGTITDAPELFLNFCVFAEQKGYKVYIVTMRYPSECGDIPEVFKRHTKGVFATSRMAKKKFMFEQGININIWIDDNPLAVEVDAIKIWNDVALEGQPVVATHNPNESERLHG